MNTLPILQCDSDPDFANQLGCLRQCHECYCYEHALNDATPNYPLPAVRLVTTIDAEFVAIWEFGVKCAYYHDDYETVWN